MSSESDVARIWQPGDVILDLYEVRDVVRTGAMGLIYRVLHRGWNEELAVKTPDEELMKSATGVRNFEVEADAWVGLGLHPHTVNCVYVRRLGGLPRVFAEWVDGGNLAEAVRKPRIYEDGPHAALRRILDVSIQFAWGLEHAHRHRLIHQDVKPANVLLTRDWTVKVTDFGLARGRAASGQSSVVAAGESVLASYAGMTPAYCSPEQARAAAGGPEVLTRATDVWSWALCVLEMFVGPPKKRSYGPDGAEVFAALVQEGPPHPRIPDPPILLAELLGRCFEVDPSDRPSEMGALADVLVEIYAEVVGEEYPREQPSAARLLAGGLGNQALSMLDIGQPARAEELWEQALHADPRDSHAVYNRGLHRWRNGRITDQELVAELEAVRLSHSGDWIDEYLLGLVHRERGDAEVACDLLSAAARRASGSPDVLAELTLARGLPAVRRPISLDSHTSRVTSAAVSADARVALTSSFAGTVRVSDAQTGRGLRTLRHEPGVACVAVSADGRLALSSGDDGSVQVWEVATGRCLRTLKGHTKMVRSIAVSADGRVAVSSGDEGKLCAWDLDTGRCVRTQVAPCFWQFSRIWFAGQVAVGADGRLALACYDATKGIDVWEVATGRVLYSVDCKGPNFALSVDGRVAVSHTPGGALRVWMLETDQVLHSADCHTGLGGPMAVSNDGHLVLSGGPDGSLRVWEPDSGRRLRTLPCHTCGIGSIALSGDGRLALTGGEDGTVRALELAPAGPRSPWSYSRPRTWDKLGHQAGLVDGAVGRVDRLVERGRLPEAARVLREARDIEGYQHHAVLLERWWRVGRGGRRTGVSAVWRCHDLPGRRVREGSVVRGRSVALSPDGRLALTSDEDGTVRVWDVATGACLHALQGHTDWITAVVIRADGRLALSAGADGAVRVWELETARCLHALQGDTEDRSLRLTDVATGRPDKTLSVPVTSDRITTVVVSADGRRALSGGRDGTIQAWDLATGRCQHTFLGGNKGFVNSLGMTADGCLAVSSGYNAPVRVWDLSTGRCLHTLQGHTRFVRSVAVSADGRFAVSASDDRTVRVWELATGQCLHVLHGHTAEVVALSLSADSQLALSSGPDATVRVWELATGRCLHTLEGHTDWVGCHVVSADGRFALSGSDDRTVRVWDLATGRCIHTLEENPAGVESVSLSFDGRYVLAGCEDGTARVWELDWDFEFPGASGCHDPGAAPAGGRRSRWAKLFKPGGHT